MVYFYLIEVITPPPKKSKSCPVHFIRIYNLDSKIRQEQYKIMKRSISLMNINAKFLNKVLANYMFTSFLKINIQCFFRKGRDDLTVNLSVHHHINRIKEKNHDYLNVEKHQVNYKKTLYLIIQCALSTVVLHAFTLILRIIQCCYYLTQCWRSTTLWKEKELRYNDRKRVNIIVIIGRSYEHLPIKTSQNL